MLYIHSLWLRSIEEGALPSLGLLLDKTSFLDHVKKWHLKTAAQKFGRNIIRKHQTFRTFQVVYLPRERHSFYMSGSGSSRGLALCRGSEDKIQSALGHCSSLYKQNQDFYQNTLPEVFEVYWLVKGDIFFLYYVTQQSFHSPYSSWKQARALSAAQRTPRDRPPGTTSRVLQKCLRFL